MDCMTSNRHTAINIFWLVRYRCIIHKYIFSNTNNLENITFYSKSVRISYNHCHWYYSVQSAHDQTQCSLYSRKTLLKSRTKIVVKYRCTFGALLIYQNCEISSTDKKDSDNFSSWIKAPSNTELNVITVWQNPTITTMEKIILAFHFPCILPWKLNLRIQNSSWVTMVWQTLSLGKSRFNAEYCAFKTLRALVCKN